MSIRVMSLRNSAGMKLSAPWLRDAPSAALFAALDGQARFVGGAVRDALIGRPVVDIDVATPLPPDQVLARLERAGIRAIPTGLAHGTVTAVPDRRSYEVTSLRRDVETDGRHAVVAFTEDYAVDAARRDFTMNALYADPDGTLFDPVGGVDDLMAGRVRFIGDPAARIAEDYLRVLRFFRFHAWYGRTEPEQEALDACRDAAPKLQRLAGERVWAELRRLLAAPDPRPALAMMAAAGVLEAVLPGAALAGLDTLLPREPRPSSLRRLAALGAETGHLKLSRAEAERLAAIAAIGVSDDADWVLLKHHGRDAVIDGAILAGRPQLRETATHWNDPRLPVTGEDVLAAGVPPGPEVGRILAGLERRWFEDGAKADRDVCLQWLKVAALGRPPHEPASDNLA